MKRRTTVKTILAVAVVVLASQLAMAQSQNDQSQSVSSGSVSAKQVSAVRSKDTSNGTLVTITSDEMLSDYGAYRNGDNFLILIPQVSLALNNVHVEGTAFADAKVEARGTNLAFSFRLKNGVTVSVSQRANQLEVNFARLEVASLGGVSTSAAPPPKTCEVESSNLPTTPKSTTDSNTRFRSSNSRENSAAAVNRDVATSPPQDADDKNLTTVDVDLAVPESPAFTVLGVTPENVTHPTSAREFATSFLNGVDQRGNFQTGLALDFLPYLTFFGKETSLSDYAKSRMERFLARTQFSFATAKGVTDQDKSTRLALGLRMTLWDKGDPRLDSLLEACYDKADDDPRFEDDAYVPAPDDPQEVKDQKFLKREQLLAELTKPCDDDARKRNWNASGWIVGAAPSWISKTGETRNFVWNGGGFWSSIAYGFENVKALQNSSQLIFHVRYRNNEIVPDTNNPSQFFSQDSLFLGGRLRIAPGEEAKSILSLEGNFIRSRRNKGPYDSSSRFSLGLEQRIADNIWFALSLGGQGGRQDGANQAFVLSSFKWGFQQKKQ
ncbi:MAG TPA: hypothetical protein VFH31_09555 [Pyrinomonadaceae bacterium]|nr:hypothetical protein [Pyrinomonadaceae bacterium]